MNTQTVADQFTALCKAGRFDEAGDTFWAEDVVSLEPGDAAMARAEGRAAVRAKGDWWVQNHEVHSMTTEGPQVNGDQFTVRYAFDVTPKGGERQQMDEIALYTVRDGKIVEERFFY